MSDIRFVSGGSHAVTLLTDILRSVELSLDEDQRPYFHDTLVGLDTSSPDSTHNYMIGFQDHLPFGYACLYFEDIVAEVRGPHLYPEYSTSEFAEAILNHAIEIAGNRKSRLLYALVPSKFSHILSAYARLQFEEISENIEFIKRWRDGLLADRSIPPRSILFARLMDTEPSSVSS